MDGKQVTLSNSDAQAITLENADGVPLVVVSEVGSDGRTFAATRTDAPDWLPSGRRSAGGAIPLP